MTKEEKEIERREDLRERNISLILDSYNEIFSDFDPRHYSEKALSDDFLSEIKRASRDKGEGVELKFLAPKSRRNLNEEVLIRRRLREHFKKHFLGLKKEKKRTIKQGFYFVLAGIFFMFIATLILFRYKTESLVTSFLVVFLEPAGWFSFWEGLDLIIFDSKKINPELVFYRKMSKADIIFKSY